MNIEIGSREIHELGRIIMRAVQITKPGKMELIQVPKPDVGDCDVQIQVANVGICGTDIHILLGEYEAEYPIIPGHEFSGTVVNVGKDVRYFQVGDHVTADPNIPCHKCPQCKRGYLNQCDNLEAAGVTRDGAFAEFISLPEQVVYPIDQISFEEAAMIEPLACVMWGVKRVKPAPGDSALLFGAGPMGCLVLQVLKTCGVSPIHVVDKINSRLDLAKELGASITHQISNTDELAYLLKSTNFKIVVDATGISEVLQNAFLYVKPRGKIWVFGVVPPDEINHFSPYEVFRKDLTIIGSFAVNQTFTESISLIKSGGIHLSPLISHQIPLSKFNEAFDLAQRDPSRMKVQISNS
jgi:2-desacetyl-2-hydroxyethyl bacteriochlorophyllide A dehydrogenase